MTSPTHKLNCLNCGAEMHGAYCHRSGQKEKALTPGVRDFLDEVIRVSLHLDGKILNTVKVLVTEPGQITKDFVEGRRVRYIAPLRLYLTFSVLFFLVAALVPNGFIRVSSDNFDPESAADFAESIVTNLPRVAFMMMPVFGMLTFWFCRRRQPFYFTHLYYSVHFHTFTFLLFTLFALLSVAGPTGRVIGTVVWAPMTILYHFKALKLFFDEPWGRTLWKGLAVGALYWVVLIAAMMLLIFVSLGLELLTAIRRGPQATPPSLYPQFVSNSRRPSSLLGSAPGFGTNLSTHPPL